VIGESTARAFGDAQAWLVGSEPRDA